MGRSMLIIFAVLILVVGDETQEVPTQAGIKEKPKVKIPETGEQTQITSKVKDIAGGIKGEGVIAVMKIADHIKSMDVIDASEGPDFTRTAEEILEGDGVKGCNEAGVVFAALLRAKGTPTTYIQALDREFLINYDVKKPSLRGHVFLEADFGDNGEGGENKKIINSTTGEITGELPENMVVGGRGFDAWDIGLKEGFGDLQEMFEEKREEIASEKQDG